MIRTAFMCLVLSGAIVNCGSNPESHLNQGKKLTGKEWAHADLDKVTLALDKWFGSKTSTVDFFDCVAKSGVDHYIATYNPNLKGGLDVDYHLSVADKANYNLSAYYAWNNSSGLSDKYIDLFVEKIKDFDIKYVFIDIETKAGNNTDEYVYKLYKKVCEEEGYNCGVYTNHWAMQKVNYPKNPKTPLSDLVLWYADDSNSVNPIRKFSTPFYGWTQTNARQSWLNDSFCGQLVDISVFDKSIL